MLLNDLFPRIYVVNLPEHKQRLEDAKKELAKIGLTDYIIFEGVKVNGGKTLQDREAGCKLAHLAIIEQCKNEGVERVAIFEDDIQIKDTFLQKLEKVKDFILNELWDLFYLGGNINIHSGRHFDIVNDDIIRVDRCYATHAYCISSNVYGKILQFDRLKLQYDVLLSMLIQSQHKKSYCIRPRQVGQKNGFSYIMDRQVNYDIVLEDKKNC